MHEPATVDAILAEIARTARETHTQPDLADGQKRRFQSRVASLIPTLDVTAPRAKAPDGRALHVGDFLWNDDVDFVEDAYLAVLGRRADRGGREALLKGLDQRTISRVGILVNLLASPEARGRDVKIRGLRLARLLERAAQTPKVGRLFSPLLLLVRLPGLIAALEGRIAGLEQRSRALAAHSSEVALGARQCLVAIEAHINDVECALLAEAKDTQNIALKAVDEVAAIRQKVISEARALNELATAAKQRLTAALPPEESAKIQAIDEHALDDLYLAFENRFRGSRDLITERIRRYLPLVASCEPAASGAPILDIGCGRGEWLDLLRANGVPGIGIDLNVAMVGAARSRGHEIVEGDAIKFLRETPPNSLAGITGFHIVEHLAFRDLISLLDEAYRTLKSGGIILFETPNPECIVVGACNFYYDPTHRNPLPPELMRFLAEARGFETVRIIRQDQDCDLDQKETGFQPQEIASWFQMPMDYALYARKL